ncbi:MAG: SDR family oxidoreductase [Chloroflexi bacterium]|nr:SDR family oxidoreductase [Chloroflexota bacterium]
MDLQLSGKVAIVTGASRGIGRAIAMTLSVEGMKLVLAARSIEGLEETTKLCQTVCLIQAVDLREPDAPGKVVSNAIEHFKQIDVLVNCAGAAKRGDFLALSDKDWADGYALKFFGAMRLSRAAWPHLQKTHGNIINISGIGGRTGSTEFTIGGSVNAALLNLTKALANRGTKDGIRVNAINPGSIATERLQKRIQNYASEHNVDEVTAAEQMAQELGVSRFGSPDEIARMVVFLASPQAGYCHGAIIDIDGGQTRTL